MHSQSRPALLKLFVDGASRGNPGPSAGGIVLADADGVALVERGYFFGQATNNAAEYRGLLCGLELAAGFHPERLEIFCDSELVVRQITGAYRVRNPDLQKLFEQVQLALLKFDSWQIRHIPRSANQRADRLANLAINRKADVEDAGDDVPSVQPGQSAAEDARAAGPAVCVKVVLGCEGRVCPATMLPGEVFSVGSVTPAGLCTHAAQAVLPAAMNVLEKMESDGPDAVEPVAVDCPRAGCHARFELTPVRPGADD